MKEKIVKIYAQAVYDDLPPNVFADEILNLLSISGSLSFEKVDELLETQRINCVVAVMSDIKDDVILEKIARAPMYDYKKIPLK